MFQTQQGLQLQAVRMSEELLRVLRGEDPLHGELQVHGLQERGQQLGQLGGRRQLPHQLQGEQGRGRGRGRGRGPGAGAQHGGEVVQAQHQS